MHILHSKNSENYAVNMIIVVYKNYNYWLVLTCWIADTGLKIKMQGDFE